MSTDAQAQVTAFWNMVAPGYEAHRGNVPAYASAEYQRWAEMLDREVPGCPAEVLDLATGTGFVAIIMATLGHHVTAVDLAPEMLREANQAAGEHGLPITFQLGDAVHPAFEPGTFDVITCRHLLWTLRQPELAIANWHRVLRPGGRIVAMDGFWFGPPAPTDDEPEAFRRFYTPETRHALPFMHLETVEPITAAFTLGGFDHVTSRSAPELANETASRSTAYVVVAIK